MKHRNPLFVAGFPYTGILIGYFGLQIIFTNIGEDAETISTSSMIGILSALLLMLIGAVYTLYWLIDTARVLRRETGLKIPPAILLFIPFANWWWMWRYSQVAEVYTKGKIQGVLGFILLVLLGSIGTGILQDSYNKLNKAPEPPASEV